MLVIALAIVSMAFPVVKWATQARHAGIAIVIADDKPQQNDSAKGQESARPESPVTQANSLPDPAVEIEYLPRPSRFERQLLAALEKPIDVEFTNLALEACLTRLQETSKLPFWIDKQTLHDDGIALDQPVTLDLNGARLESVLNLLVTPAQLAYLPDNDVLMITTAAKAHEKMITRTYPVHDLLSRGERVEPVQKNDKPADEGTKGSGVASIGSLSPSEQAASVIQQVADARPGRNVEVILAQGFGGGGRGRGAAGNVGRDGAARPVQYDFLSLMNLINTTIEPDSWEELSGPGSVMPFRPTLSLVIRQNWAVHRKVLQLLRDLREAKRVSPPDATAPLMIQRNEPNCTGLRPEVTEGNHERHEKHENKIREMASSG